MRWVTREHIHMDRVASPWLIQRFIDPDAEFLFIDPNSKPWPADAVPFALPGAEIGPFDGANTTFHKLLRHHALTDPVLHDIADVVRAGIYHLAGSDQGEASAETISLGVALLALSEGVMLRHSDDYDNLRASAEMYDALYAFFWARRKDSRTEVAIFGERMAGLRDAWRAERGAGASPA